jgi:hypothetical protein
MRQRFLAVAGAIVLLAGVQPSEDADGPPPSLFWLSPSSLRRILMPLEVSFRALLLLLPTRLPALPQLPSFEVSVLAATVALVVIPFCGYCRRPRTQRVQRRPPPSSVSASYPAVAITQGAEWSPLRWAAVAGAIVLLAGVQPSEDADGPSSSTPVPPLVPPGLARPRRLRTPLELGSGGGSGTLIMTMVPTLPAQLRSLEVGAAATMLLGLLLLLLLLGVFWCCRRRAPQQPRSGSVSIGATSTSEVGTCWWSSPLASPAEAETIGSATPLVLAQGLGPLPKYAELEMLRQLRALGSSSCTPQALAAAYVKALRWRRENVLRPAGACGDRSSRKLWYSAREHAHGGWASTRIELGLCIGRATGGHPVKIERVGRSDIASIVSEAGGSERLLMHYYSILESILVALNAESVACGRLLQMYEIFDLAGLSVFKCSLHAIRTVTVLVGVIIGTYAETTAKAVLLNLPLSVATIVRGILRLLPDRVAARVLVLGEGETYDFSGELDSQAMQMLTADRNQLSRHEGTPASGSVAPEGVMPGRPFLEDPSSAGEGIDRGFIDPQPMNGTYGAAVSRAAEDDSRGAVISVQSVSLAELVWGSSSSR